MSAVPNVVQMLKVAEDCGLKTIEEAYHNYLHHYDAFFLIEKYNEQLQALTMEIKSYGLTEIVDGRLLLKELTIKQA